MRLLHCLSVSSGRFCFSRCSLVRSKAAVSKTAIVGSNPATLASFSAICALPAPGVRGALTADIAHQVERLPCKQDVAGSSPAVGSISKYNSEGKFMDKKAEQLGMNAGTASHRLTKDILFQFVTSGGHKCFRCGKDLQRENFSIEHKKPWLDSIDPIGLFFDLENIAYSHLSCNVSAARRTNKKYSNPDELKAVNNLRDRNRWHAMSPEERKASRRARYEKHGC